VVQHTPPNLHWENGSQTTNDDCFGFGAAFAASRPEPDRQQPAPKLPAATRPSPVVIFAVARTSTKRERSTDYLQAGIGRGTGKRLSGVVQRRPQPRRCVCTGQRFEADSYRGRPVLFLSTTLGSSRMNSGFRRPSMRSRSKRAASIPSWRPDWSMLVKLFCARSHRGELS
jgi:hypothetical protein